MTAPIASGWSGCRMGFAPTGKRRLCTAHIQPGHSSTDSFWRIPLQKSKTERRRKSRKSRFLASSTTAILRSAHPANLLTSYRLHVGHPALLSVLEAGDAVGVVRVSQAFAGECPGNHYDRLIFVIALRREHDGHFTRLYCGPEDKLSHQRRSRIRSAARQAKAPISCVAPQNLTLALDRNKGNHCARCCSAAVSRVGFGPAASIGCMSAYD